MPIVFYAWQSDRDPKLCRRFIEKAIKRAIKKLNADATVQKAPAFEFDQDRQGVSGHPHIASVIRRKIKTCDVFLADLTHVADYTTHDSRKKSGQNPNVLIELGIAIRAKGFTRLILVMNDAFGPPVDLPFDLKSHSFPITYTLASLEDKTVVQSVLESLTATIAKALQPMLTQIAMGTAVTRREAEEQAERQRQLGMVNAQTKYKEFITSLWLGRFRNMGEKPTVGIAVIPLYPSSEPLDLSDIEHQVRHALWPLGARHAHFDIDGHSIVAHTAVLARDGTIAEPSKNVSELNDSGMIFGADDMYFDPAKNETYPLQHGEREWIQAIYEYISLLRALKITGPLVVRIGLVRIQGAWLLADNHNRYGISWRKFPRENFDLDPVILPDEPQTEQSIATAMRKATTVLWREVGLGRDPCFDEAGQYRNRI